jgi:diguanylate cyclase (GGDEF)-like protein/PAS domain S-box-containing protein
MHDISIYIQALESTRDGLVITRRQGRNNIIVYANPAFSKLTGYHLSEILEKDNRFLQGVTTTLEDKEKMRHAIDNLEPLLITLKNFKKDGTPFWNELSLSPIKDAKGICIYYVGIQKDVTERIELQNQLMEKNNALETLNKTLEMQSKLDILTQLYNRTVLDDKASLLLELARREAQWFSVLFIDIDKFKKINDQYGHQAGDKSIQKVAKTIQGLFKRPSDLAIRYGGEEFLILTYGNNQAESELLAEKLRKTIEGNAFSINQTSISFTVSIGLFCCQPNRQQTLDGIIHQADLAMYEAKRSGRNLVKIAPCSSNDKQTS